jgi:uncharacterized repeat protein (TIGR02543 family)
LAQLENLEEKMKKKWYWLTVFMALLCMFTGLLKINVAAEVIKKENQQGVYDGLEYEYNNDTLCIIDYYGTEEELVIPAEINGKRVTSIGRSAFADRESLKHIVLPEGLKGINQYAFRGCSNLVSISLPASLGKIEGGGGSLEVFIFDIFDGCSSLTNIDVAKGNAVYTSESGALYNNEKTELILCPAGKESITIPESVTTVRNTGRSAFYDNSSLKDIIVEGGNAKYTSEDGVLYNKEKTELVWCPPGKDSVEVPESVTTICQEQEFFSGKYFDVAIAEKNTVYACEEGVYYNKEEKELIRCSVEKEGSVIVPEGIITIKEGAFGNCGKIEKIGLPMSITDVEGRIFGGCSSLEEITVAEGNASYISRDGILYENYYRDKEHEEKEIELIKCPEGKTGAILVLKDVIRIDYGNYGGAFYNCKSLEEIIVQDGNPYYASEDGILYNREKTRLLYCPAGKRGAIKISKKVTGIEGKFRDSNVTEIVVEEENTAYTSFDGVLYDKEKTNMISVPGGKEGSITIPESVINIDIYGCSRLTDVIIMDGNTKFASCDGILYNKEKTQLISCPKGRENPVIVPEGVTDIAVSAFLDCECLESVMFPASVTNIGGGIAYGTNLKGVYYAGSKEDWGNIKKDYRASFIGSRTGIDPMILHYNACAIIFNSENGKKECSFLSKGEMVPKPADPVRNGYLFEGWYMDKNYNQKYDFSLPVDNNFELFAKWTKNVQNSQNENITVTSVSFKKKKYQIAQGKKIDLNQEVTVLPVDVENKKLLWKVSNSKYAKVQNGVVKVLKAGAGKKITVTAAANDGSGKMAVVRIQIMKNAVKNIKLKAGKARVKAGNAVVVKAIITPDRKKGINKNLKWTSSNTKYATVNSKGRVKTLKAGRGKTVTITAAATDGSGKKKSIKLKIF